MFGKTNSTTILNGTITKGVSLTHENLSSSNPIINNNISITNNDTKDNQSPSIECVVKSEGETQLNQEPNERIQLTTTERIQGQSVDLKAENEFLKAILRIYVSQKLYFSGKHIICTPQELIQLIQLLTNGEVEIETEQIEVSCLGNPKTPFSKVLNLWVTKDDCKCVFKYAYSQFLSLFDEYNISLKVVRVI